MSEGHGLSGLVSDMPDTLRIFPGESQVGEHYSSEQWAAWVGEQRESELNVAEFCDWIEFLPISFYRWRQKLAAKGRPLARQQPEARRLSPMKRSMYSGPELVPLMAYRDHARRMAKRHVSRRSQNSHFSWAKFCAFLEQHPLASAHRLIDLIAMARGGDALDK